jgi:hypothetical protein
LSGTSKPTRTPSSRSPFSKDLAYSYAFGTNSFFNCLVKTASYLAEGLTVLFVSVMLLSIGAMVALGRTLAKIAGEFGNTVRRFYLGETIAVVIFSLVPIAITLSYGVRDYAGKGDCKKVPASVSDATWVESAPSGATFSYFL